MGLLPFQRGMSPRADEPMGEKVAFRHPVICVHEIKEERLREGISLPPSCRVPLCFSSLNFTMGSICSVRWTRYSQDSQIR